MDADAVVSALGEKLCYMVDPHFEMQQRDLVDVSICVAAFFQTQELRVMLVLEVAAFVFSHFKLQTVD